MKIILNLLPKSRAKELRRKNILRFIVWQEIVIIFIMILFFAVIKGVDAVIKLQMQGLNEQTSYWEGKSDYQEISRYESEFKKINKKISSIRKVQKNEVDWAKILLKVSDNIPIGVTVNSLDIDGEDVVVKGVAETRDDLTKMKSDFEKDGCFADVQIPLNDIVMKKNIDFRLNFKIVKDCLFGYEK